MNFFICPGAQKAGTTLLYDLLKHNPQIGLTSFKETKYFLKNIDELNAEQYTNQYFEKSKNTNILGDIDPEYMYYSNVPEKIFKILGGDVKFIFMLRNPVDRAYSHYWMSYKRGFELLNFEEAIDIEKERLQKRDKMSEWHFSYMDRGFYSEQINNYLKFYTKKQFHFVVFENFVVNIQEEMDKIYEFLEVNSCQIPTKKKKSNEGLLPRSNTLRKLHGQPSILKNILKLLIPIKKFRWKLYPLVEKMNTSKLKYQKLDSGTKQKLLKKYYSEEIIRLTNITGIDIRSFWT